MLQLTAVSLVFGRGQECCDVSHCVCYNLCLAEDRNVVMLVTVCVTTDGSVTCVWQRTGML